MLNYRLRDEGRLVMDLGLEKSCDIFMRCPDLLALDLDEQLHLNYSYLTLNLTL